MYTIEKQENNKYKVVIKLNKEEWESYVNRAYEETKHKFAVQGFRKGKAPRRFIEQNYGPTIFYDDALEIIFDENYREIIAKETYLDPVEEPEISIGKFDETGLDLDVIIQSYPEVKLGAYTGLEIEGAKGEVTEDKIDAELNQVRERFAKFNVVERAAQLGDFATIDFVGRVDGKEFEGGKAEGFTLELGSKSFIDTFEEQLVGMQIGEKRTINVKFPEDYFSADLKGKPAEFDVALVTLEEKELPALDDDFAKNVSQFDSLDEYKADIKKHLQESLDGQLEQETKNKIIETIVEKADVVVPQSMINNEINNMLKDFETRLSYQGLTLEQYLEYAQTDLEGFKKTQEEPAEKVVKTRLVLGEIIKAEKLQVTAEELDAKMQEIAGKYNKSLEDYKKSVSERELSYIENDILMEKLFSFLKSNNSIK